MENVWSRNGTERNPSEQLSWNGSTSLPTNITSQESAPRRCLLALQGSLNSGTGPRRPCPDHGGQGHGGTTFLSKVAIFPSPFFTVLGHARTVCSPLGSASRPVFSVSRMGAALTRQGLSRGCITTPPRRNGPYNLFVSSPHFIVQGGYVSAPYRTRLHHFGSRSLHTTSSFQPSTSSSRAAITAPRILPDITE